MSENFKNVEAKIKVNLLLVEDHLITAELLKMQIEKATDYQVIDILQTGADIINYNHYNDVSVVITDYMLPDMKGCQIVNHIMSMNPDIKIIVLSGYSDIHIIQNCFKAGIHGYISKESSINNVINSIYCVLNGGNFICNHIVMSLFKNNLNNNNNHNDNDFHKFESIKSILTKREDEVIRLIADGKKNCDIANELYISERTVETHRRNILKKFGQDNIISVIKEWLNLEPSN